MYLQALLIRAAAATTASALLAATILIDCPAHSPHQAAPARMAQVATSPSPQTVTLPTIHVHPTAADYAAAAASNDETVVTRIETTLRSDVPETLTPSLSGLGVDMPYYSFGKVLPRINSKE